MTVRPFLCKLCGEKFMGAFLYTCPNCGRPGEAFDANWTLEAICEIQRPASRTDPHRKLVGDSWIYRCSRFLPTTRRETAVSFDEPVTPLINLTRAGEAIGMRNLWAKDETRNPTGSFKDRASSISISAAVEAGLTEVCAASDGNFGASISAYATRAGMKPYVMLFPEATPEKIAQIMGCGGVPFFTGGSIGDRVRFFLELQANRNFYLANLDHIGNPLNLEGYKTIAIEICEQMKWIAPKTVIMPAGTGESLAGVWKGFCELRQAGWTVDVPRMIAVQACGNDPLLNAINSVRRRVSVLPSSTPSVCRAISSDVSGYLALSVLLESRGTVESISDTEVIEAQRMLSHLEGIYVEPSSAVVFAAANRMVADGVIDPDEYVVCILTSTGLKSGSDFPCNVPTIEPRIGAFEDMRSKL